MDKSYLIEHVERDCPLCNKVHLVEKRKRESQMLIKNEEVTYEEIYLQAMRKMSLYRPK